MRCENVWYKLPDIFLWECPVKSVGKEPVKENVKKMKKIENRTGQM